MIEKAIRQLLLDDEAIFAETGRQLYPIKEPDNAGLPRIVYSRIGGSPSASLGGRSGLVRATIELILQAKTADDLRRLEVLVRKRLDVTKQTIAGVSVLSIDVADEQDEPPKKAEEDEPSFSARITADCWFRD